MVMGRAMKTRESGMPDESAWDAFFDPATPRGPSMGIRPRPEQCREWTRQAGFELIQPHVDLPPYHYGIAGRKP